MYARAQTQMSRLRDMATRGMKSAAAAAAAAATEMKSMAAGASASPSPSRGSREYSAFDAEPARPDGSPASGHRRATNVAGSPDPRAPAARLAERLDAGAAAAEILFDMRAHSGRGGASVTAEEAETLHELRETCEDHLNTLARVVESGGVHDDALLQRAIEVAESLVAAIGDDETVAAAAAAETESRGYAPPAADPAVGISSGAADDSGTEGGQRERRDLADLLGGLDVDPGGRGIDVAAPAERPSTEAEEEAMVAAAIAASLAEAAPPAADQAPRQEQAAQQTPPPPANLIDF